MSHKERSSGENLGRSTGAKGQPERERRQRRVHWWGEAPEQPDCFRGAKDLLLRKIVTYANTRAEPGPSADQVRQSCADLFTLAHARSRLGERLEPA